jgi:Ca-activated chloride channel family protein
MKKRSAIAGAVVLAAVSILVAQQGIPPTTIKVGVKLVRMLVSVKDSQNKLVGSLQSKDFTIYDCGVKQEIAVFEQQTEQPLSISLMVDISGSTFKDLPYEVTSAEKFFRAVLAQGNPKDAVALYSFNDDVSLVEDFTRDAARLGRGLRSLRASAGTSLYDALLLASEKISNRDGRHVLVVVTDGDDVTSHVRYAKALEAANLASATVYGVVVIPITNPAGRNIGGEHALEQIASDTGGRVFAQSVGVRLDAAFSDILKELRTQYLLGYYPRDLPKDAPRFHPVRIEMSRPDLRPQARNGYYETSLR